MAKLRLCLLLLVAIVSTPTFAWELVAHRGVYQNFDHENLTMTACTATRIFEPTHTYLENTVSSIRRAFELGATMVELDVHPTVEDAGPDQLIVFHDWELECRTNATCETCKCSDGRCVTNQQTLAYLQSLDIGYGYTYDGGKTFPFRGYAERAPSFEDVLQILEDFPQGKLLINKKGNADRTVQAFVRIIESYPSSIRKRVLFPREVEGGPLDAELAKLGIPESIYQGGGKYKECIKQYALVGWSGRFPVACHNLDIFVDPNLDLGLLYPYMRGIKFTDVIWGWPHQFISRAHANGTRVFAAGINTTEQLEQVVCLDIDGLMTDKIEVMASEITNARSRCE